uniref:ATP synthase F0 subunit 8 n=1 Tax=Tympanophyllum maximum TaxID=3039643 RepID=UPI0025520BD8|nr:ATP synthase F0 subunit 8 [Tympanophyllum maximum]WFP43218.1 ATP synthase F0 subunit 8 [Tympanophyllum maximum]
MPQMSPLSWAFLFPMFTCMFLSLILMNYSYQTTSPTTYQMPLTSYLQSFNWKW